MSDKKGEEVTILKEEKIRTEIKPEEGKAEVHTATTTTKTTIQEEAKTKKDTQNEAMMTKAAQSRMMDTKAPFATTTRAPTMMPTKIPMMSTKMTGSPVVVTQQHKKKVDTVKEHKTEGWVIQSKQTSIVGADRLKEYEDALKTLSLPEMLFDSYIELKHEKLTMKFDAMGALQDALLTNLKNYEGGAVDSVKVSCSWNSSDIVEDRILGKKTKIEERQDNMEWTFNSIYQGDYSVDEEEDDEGIDYELLKKPEQITFFEDIILFEDELHDHGTCESRVKIRCMPSCFFLLLRCFLRVDGVIVRIIDTRVFHRFGSDKVVKEHTFREAAIPALAKTMPMLVNDPKTMRSPDKIARFIPLKFKKVSKFTLS